MENLITIFGWNLAAVIGLMFCGWLISLIYKNVSIVDSLWGLGFVLIAWLTFGLAEGFAGRKILIVLLTTAWGLPLWQLEKGKRRPILDRQSIQSFFASGPLFMGDRTGNSVCSDYIHTQSSDRARFSGVYHLADWICF